MRNIRTQYRLLLVVVACLLSGWAVETSACGCGMYIPREGEARVAEERAVVRWDGKTEDIVMQLAVEGNSSEAAWILPTPSPATAKLGDSGLFESLRELTEPLVETRYRFTWWGLLSSPEDGAAGNGEGMKSAVQLLTRQQLGPFDVSVLDATDAKALSGWLAQNGYKFPEGLDSVLTSYVEQHWSYVAVRLKPESGDAELGGELQPLWVSFASPSLVYPMRASSRAKGQLPLYLYILADHRVAPQQSFGFSRISYADWVEPGTLPAGSPLAPLVPHRLFLTKLMEVIHQPDKIDGDYTFKFVDGDPRYRDVNYNYVNIPVPPIAGAVLVPVALATGFVMWKRRRRQQR